MSFTKRVAATAALLLGISACASAAILGDVSSASDDQTIAAESQTNAPSDSGSALTTSVTSGVMLSSASANSCISTQIAVPPSMNLLGEAPRTVTLPAGLTLIQAKPRAAAPSHLYRSKSLMAGSTTAK